MFSYEPRIYNRHPDSASISLCCMGFLECADSASHQLAGKVKVNQIQRVKDADVEYHHTPYSALTESFLEFVDGDRFPCVGAKSALARGSIETHEFGLLGDRDNDKPLIDGLSRFVDMIEASTDDKNIVHSHVAIFSGPNAMSESRFEAILWSQLSRIHRLDVLAGNRSAQDVSSNADNPHFSLSIAGHPFFVIGLHSNASRLARRFSYPVLVFNSHRQFERLKEDGRYFKMQAATRSRDIKLQGSVNPNLADFGKASEARQYSGREVEASWRCPYAFDDQR